VSAAINTNEDTCGKSSLSFDRDSGIILPNDVGSSLNNLDGVTAGTWAKIDKTGRAQLFYKHVTFVLTTVKSIVLPGHLCRRNFMKLQDSLLILKVPGITLL
jgi:hypothetical protein